MQHMLVDNRYESRDLLGSGGMAKVYLAHDQVLDRDVALKVLREQFAEDAEFSERFKREAQSAAALSHPNIVQVYDRGRAEDSSFYMAMEYVPGGTLKDRILGQGPLEPREAASLALQVAEALGEAHGRKVIHRDIKPQNVLLTATGEAKVADFGIARAASATTISQRSVVLGTASYMSPEQAMGEPATPRSDLYSLGVVLYEMLTGELPYTAENPVAVSLKHVNEPLRSPRELNPEIPVELNTLVTKLLAKNPKDRYESAAELSEDLRRVREGLPPIAADPPGGLTKTTRVETQATRSLPPSTKRRRDRRIPWILAAVLALLALLGGAWALSQGVLDSTLGEAAGVTVPDVEGLSEEQARQRLTSSGFEVNVDRRESSADAAGTVLEQSPPSGERAERGSRMTIVVGDGPAPVEVPNVIGMSLPEAQATLDRAGLAVGSQREIPSNTAPQGVVIEQRPPAGTQVEPGTAVNLGISSGPQQAAPDPPVPASASPTATATASPTASATASATATATAPAEEAEDIDEDNSGPGGGGNSGPGSSGSEGGGD